MGFDWLTGLLGGGAKDVLQGVGGLAKDIRVAITGKDPLTAEQRAALEMQLTMMEAAAQKAAADFDMTQITQQTEILKIDAASGSGFRTNWRPALGWVCVLGFFYSFLMRPLLPWGVQVFSGGVQTVPPLPELDMVEAGMLLSGMLGLGTMRTFEKIKGVNK